MRSIRPRTSNTRRFAALALLALPLLAVSACRLTDVALWQPAPPAGTTFAVESIRDVAYHSGPDADETRHRLDLFLPRGPRGFPVVLLVHGGAWMIGDNRCCGLYSSVGEFLASQGVGAVLPNYRLSPGVKHPQHAQDVARAFAWAHGHIAEHGGDPGRIFLAGHSAGGHLVSLLATDGRYLAAHGLRSEDVRGVMTVSGVYRVPSGKLTVSLCGDGLEAFRLGQVVPFRGRTGRWPSWGPACPGLPVALNVFGPAFGDDPQVREDASPTAHARPGLPPFLILYAEEDLPLLAGMAEEFHEALLRQGCAARLVRVEKRNHHSVFFRAVAADDPVARLLLEFVRQHPAR